MRGAWQHMLEVVQDEKHLPRSEEAFHALERGVGARFPQPEYLRDRRGDETRISNRRQINKEHAVAEAGEQGGCGLQSETGLTSAAGPRECDQTSLRLEHQLADRFELLLPPDERGRSGGQVMRRNVRGTRQGPEGREVGRQTRHVELENLLGKPDVLQLMWAEVAQRRPWRQVVAHQALRRLRKEDLAAVPSRGDARGHVDIHPDVLGVADHRLAGMQGHTYAHRNAVGPVV